MLENGPHLSFFSTLIMQVTQLIMWVGIFVGVLGVEVAFSHKSKPTKQATLLARSSGKCLPSNILIIYKFI